MFLIPDLGGELKVSGDTPGGARPQLAVTSDLVISAHATTT